MGRRRPMNRLNVMIFVLCIPKYGLVDTAYYSSERFDVPPMTGVFRTHFVIWGLYGPTTNQYVINVKHFIVVVCV